MTIREISIEYWSEISGGNGHSNYEAGGSSSKTKSRQSTIQRGANVDIYKDVNPQCIADILSGVVDGMKEGPFGALSGVLTGGAINSCTASSTNNNTNGGGSISVGQCTW